jgi:drug/metabolite transporter (DMT)-like permease
VILALFSMAFLDHRLSAREWLGVALVTAGIAALGIAESSHGRPSGEISPGRLAAAVAACLAACAAAAALARLLQRSPRIRVPPVIAFSIVAGILLGLGDVGTKVLLDVLQASGFGAAVMAAGAGLIAFYVSGFLVLSRAYQHGRAILVTAVSDLCSRLVAILVGITALGEGLAGTGGLRAAAVLGYMAIIVGAVLLARFSGGDIAERLARTRSKPLRQPEEGEHSAPAQVDADD